MSDRFKGFRERYEKSSEEYRKRANKFIKYLIKRKFPGTGFEDSFVIECLSDRPSVAWWLFGIIVHQEDGGFLYQREKIERIFISQRVKFILLMCEMKEKLCDDCFCKWYQYIQFRDKKEIGCCEW